MQVDNWVEYSNDELDAMIGALREDIEREDLAQNAVMAHDLRCELDRMVASREAREET